MRLTNRRYTRTVHNLFLFSALIILFFLLLKVQHRIGISPFYIAAFFAVCIALYIFFFASYFEYDSFGSILQFRTKRFVKKFTTNRRKKVEIEKYKLKKFEIFNLFIYKSLTIYTSGGDDGHLKKHRFDITFLNDRKINLMEQSLKKVLKNKTGQYN